MIRLGLRLAVAGGRWSLVPTLLAAVAVGFGTAILLFALSFEPALQARYDHEAWRETPGPADGSGMSTAPSTLLSLTEDFVSGRPLARIDLAAVGAGAPVPPGIPRIPAPGEAFVSPKLARLIATTPAVSSATGSDGSSARSAKRASRHPTSSRSSGDCPPHSCGRLARGR